MLDVKRLRILSEVARAGSFSAAAEELYLSQSAVSQQVATLEREVGMSLLERTRAGPKLTDAGRALVTHAEAVICRLEEAERELAAIAGLEGGELRMAGFPSASATLLTEAVSSYRDRYPEGAARRRRGRAGGIAAARCGPANGHRDHLRLPELTPDEDERDIERRLLLTESMYLVAMPVEPPARRARRPCASPSSATRSG